MAFCVSAVLYRGSRAADFGRHARAVEAIGHVRHVDRQLSEQVLAARFGLLNQYDTINASEGELGQASADLGPRIREVMAVDAQLDQALRDLDAAISAKRVAAEGFKTENSILRNSTYYLPTAANELGGKLPALSVPIQRVAQTGLAYNLIGDETARQAHAQTLSELRAQSAGVPSDLQQPFGLLVAHADVIAREVPAVDGWVAQVVSNDSSDKLGAVEQAYQARFDDVVGVSTRYRNVLYGWSLVLLLAVGVAGLQLRRLYSGLELRVAERTAELQRALSALWGEMKLARKIQEALVPVAPSLDRCEIAARMEPTEEVGGDYYDVIRMKDCEWILIGDVSGHGVPAGLIMMMCHTAVRTVLACDPTVGPDRLLSLVNGTLHDNIRQLGETKYMTISAFRRSADGTVTFAGAHQDVHVFRAATGEVETLESRGIWLGLTGEIAHSLEVQQLTLGVGDVLLLHTDGITEATRDGAMFDVAGLRRTLARVGTKGAAEVVSLVFAELEGFKVNDDATVVVLKQLPEDSPLAAALDHG